MKLECSHCHYTIEVSEWNKELQNSVHFGRADELIPNALDADEWESYRNIHGGIVDCPQCGEVNNFGDMYAY